MPTPKAYMVEDYNGIVHWFWDQNEFETYEQKKMQYFRTARDHRDILRTAEILNETLMAMNFDTCDQAVGHLHKLAFYATIYPFTLLQTYEKLGLSNESIKQAEKLRAFSLYPRFIEEKILPFVKDEKGYPNFTLKNRAIHKKGKYFIYEHDTIESVQWTDDTQSILHSLLNIDSGHEIRGSIAYSGLARGSVKIVNSIQDIQKVEQGDILVTVNSNPSIMLALKKAAAIVADEGGVMCHAAIVAREMKKPCIIGTKIATQVLKDGDIVEVDANTGVVRMLKKLKK